MSSPQCGELIEPIGSHEPGRQPIDPKRAILPRWRHWSALLGLGSCDRERRPNRMWQLRARAAAPKKREKEQKTAYFRVYFLPSEQGPRPWECRAQHSRASDHNHAKKRPNCELGSFAVFRWIEGLLDTPNWSINCVVVKRRKPRS